jgi:xanthine dehydrogenase YagS FAD-binding subunit
MKDRLIAPDVVINLKAVKGLDQIAAGPNGLSIGGLTTLDAIARDAGIQQRYRVLAEAAESVATPQIRNVATIAGNVCQRPWCWYYRQGFHCFKAGGNVCYSVSGENQFHAIFGGGPSHIVHPSDTAPALIALDAQMVIKNKSGERVVSAEQFFIGPSIDITRMTVMEAGDLLTSIRIPATWAGAKFYFEKVRDRQVWDFPLVNVASALKISGGNIQQARIVVNAVAAHPMRLHAVEAAVAGKAQNEETATMAGELAIQGNQPLAHNGYKVPLMRNLVKRALRAEATS